MQVPQNKRRGDDIEVADLPDRSFAFHINNNNNDEVFLIPTEEKTKHDVSNSREIVQWRGREDKTWLAPLQAAFVALGRRLDGGGFSGSDDGCLSSSSRCITFPAKDLLLILERDVCIPFGIEQNFASRYEETGWLS